MNKRTEKVESVPEAGAGELSSSKTSAQVSVGQVVVYVVRPEDYLSAAHPVRFATVAVVNPDGTVTLDIHTHGRADHADRTVVRNAVRMDEGGSPGTWHQVPDI